MSKCKVLFIGWGNVVKDYYWEYLQPLLENGSLDIVIAEAEEKYWLAPNFYHIFGSNDLNNLIKSGIFDKIFILTPPCCHIDQIKLCLKLLNRNKNKCNIYVEKPLDIDLQKSKKFSELISKLDCIKNNQINIHLIDHYTQKWSSRWLFMNKDKIFSQIGSINQIMFLSFEKRKIFHSFSFKNGYAIEHGIHAWAMINYCFPFISSMSCSVDTSDGGPYTWRHEDCPDLCKGESSFAIKYQCVASNIKKSKYLNSKISVIIAAGKALSDDIKKLVIFGEKGKIICNFNKDLIVFKNLDRTINKINTNNSQINKYPAYKTIIESIFHKNNHQLQTTISVNDGIIALERIFTAKNFFKDYVFHKCGSTPKELEYLVEFSE